MEREELIKATISAFDYKATSLELCPGFNRAEIEKKRDAVVELLKAQPELVRCPDCLYNKNCISTEEGIEQDGFCKWGKRKDGDGDG